MRKSYFILNWKMFGFKQKILEFIEQGGNIFLENEYCIFCPPVCYLDVANQEIKSSINFKIGAQDFSEKVKMNNTGEVSVEFLKDLKIQHSIIGHSETRRNHKQTNDILLQKLELALINKIVPVFCIGEDFMNNNIKETQEFIKSQIEPFISIIKTFNNFILAYEPTWSIGNKDISDTNTILNNLLLIRKILKDNNLNNINLVYGGSVNSYTISKLNIRDFVDGYIIGSASQDINEIKKILDYERNYKTRR